MGCYERTCHKSSEIITGLATKRDTLVWTNTALHAVSYIGAPFFFGTKLLSSNTSIMGPNAMLEMDEIVYWMGSQNFYLYDGTIMLLIITVNKYGMAAL